MITWLIFWIVVPILINWWLDIQHYVDKYNWVLVGSQACAEGKYVFAHNRKRLGKRISKIKKWQIITFGWCRYKATQVRNVHVDVDYTTRIDRDKTYMQTCLNEKYNRIVTLSNIE
jgi:hypothetical protein